MGGGVTITATQVDAADASVLRSETSGPVMADGYTFAWWGPDLDDALELDDLERLTVVSVDGSEANLAAIAALAAETSNDGYSPPQGSKKCGTAWRSVADRGGCRRGCTTSWWRSHWRRAVW